MTAQNSDPAPLHSEIYGEKWLGGFRRLTRKAMGEKWDEIRNVSFDSHMLPILNADQSATDEISSAAFDQFDSMVKKTIAVYERNVGRGFSRDQLLAYWETQKNIYKNKNAMRSLISGGRSYAEFIESFPAKMSSARAGSRTATLAHNLRNPGPLVSGAAIYLLVEAFKKGVDIAWDVWFKDPGKQKVNAVVDAARIEEEKRVTKLKSDLLLIAENLSQLPANVKGQEVANFRQHLSKLRPNLKTFIGELRAKSHSKGASEASLTLNDPPALPADFDSKLDQLYAELQALERDGEALRDKRNRSDTDDEKELARINAQITSNEVELRGLKYKIAGMLGVRLAYELYLDDKTQPAPNDSRNDRFWEIAAQTSIRLRIAGKDGDLEQDYITAAVEDVRSVFEGEQASKFGKLYSDAASAVLEDAKQTNEAIANSRTKAP